MIGIINLKGHRTIPMRDDTRPANGEVITSTLTKEEWEQRWPNETYPGIDGFRKTEPRETYHNRFNNQVKGVKKNA